MCDPILLLVVTKSSGQLIYAYHPFVIVQQIDWISFLESEHLSNKEIRHLPRTHLLSLVVDDAKTLLRVFRFTHSQYPFFFAISMYCSAHSPNCQIQ